MKALNRIITLVLSYLLISNQAITADLDDINGSWEGLFMDQFKVVLQFNNSENDNYSGTIKMYDGSAKIQDDMISSIKLVDENLSFLIEAKKTEFKGHVDYTNTKIEGHFIFPDGIKYDISLSKSEGSENSELSLSLENRSILEKKFTPNQLKEDVLFIRDILVADHPQLYFYTSKEDFDALYNSIINRIDHDLTILEFYTLIAPFVNSVGCSHTGIKLPHKYEMARREFGNYLPLSVFTSQNKTWVVNSFHGEEIIEPGSELIRINQVPISDIISRLLAYVPAEGNNSTTKYHDLNKDFISYYNLIDDSESFQLEYFNPNSQKKSSVLISSDSYEKLILSDKKVDKEIPVLFSIDKDRNTANLKVTTFGIQDINWFLNNTDSIFLEIKNQNIENLILDLRGNSGGHPIFAAILYSYLSSKEFTYFKNTQEMPEFEPLYKPMQANANSFTGNCYVLTDGGCLSTTGHLISLLRYHNRAVFIGEEPGSWFYCNDNSKLHTLPNTGIEINIPQTTFETAVEGYEKGDKFKVDYSIQKSIDDLISCKDAYLIFTKQLIEKFEDSL